MDRFIKPVVRSFLTNKTVLSRICFILPLQIQILVNGKRLFYPIQQPADT